MISDKLKTQAHIMAALCAICGLVLGSVAQAQSSSGLPRLEPEVGSPDVVPQRLVQPSNVPDFPVNGSNYSSADIPDTSGQAARIPDSGPTSNYVPPANNGSFGAQGDSTVLHNSTPLQSGLQSTTLPIETHLKLILETPVDAKISVPGDIFEAHVRDDLYVGQSLLLARGSLIRGRVFTIQKPRIISRAAKVNLRLEQIVTPLGEVIPLDAALTFSKGKTNAKGELDPGTNFGSRVSSDVKTVTGANSKGTARGALVAANVATLGAPAVAAAIGGSAVALFRSGDNVELKPGDEIEVLLTNDLGLQIN